MTVWLVRDAAIEPMDSSAWSGYGARENPVSNADGGEGFQPTLAKRDVQRRSLRYALARHFRVALEHVDRIAPSREVHSEYTPTQPSTDYHRWFHWISFVCRPEESVVDVYFSSPQLFTSLGRKHSGEENARVFTTRNVSTEERSF
jgi:hypothetical protein